MILFYLTSKFNTGIFLSNLWTWLFYKVKLICHFPLLSFCVHEHKSHLNHTKQSVNNEIYYEYLLSSYIVYSAIKVTQTTEKNKRKDKKKLKGVWRHNIFESQKRNILFSRIDKFKRNFFRWASLQRKFISTL